MPSELQPAEIEALARAATTVLTPLVQEQAATQRQAVDADLEKFRIASGERAQHLKRSFVFSFAMLVLGAGTIAGFFVTGQYQFAFQSFTFFAGMAAGYGLGRSRSTQ
jgi:hypothetical protein